MKVHRPVGPFQTSIIQNDAGKVIGQIRPRLNKFMLKSYTGAHWLSEGIVKGLRTDIKVLTTRKEAINEAEKTL